MSKLKGFDILKEWIQPCVNHLHWSATTTFSGDGNLILAKFKSFLGHIVNKHDGLDDPLFSQCAHSEDIAQRKWLKEGGLYICLDWDFYIATFICTFIIYSRHTGITRDWAAHNKRHSEGKKRMATFLAC